MVPKADELEALRTEVHGFYLMHGNKIFEEYIKSFSEMIKNIEEALVNNDYKELCKISHQLKGSSGSLKIKEIFDLARTLETSALVKDKSDCELTFLEMKNYLVPSLPQNKERK